MMGNDGENMVLCMSHKDIHPCHTSMALVSGLADIVAFQAGRGRQTLDFTRGTVGLERWIGYV